MDDLDQMIRHDLQQVLETVAPPPNLWAAVRPHLRRASRRPFSGRRTAAVVGAVALGLGLGVGFPLMAAPTFAAQIVQWVFRLPGQWVTVGRAVPYHPAPAGPATEGAWARGQVVAPRQWSGPPGGLPVGARAALERSGIPWRLPTWWPAGLPVRVSLLDAPGDPLHTVTVTLGSGLSAVTVAELAPAPRTLGIRIGGRLVDARAGQLHGWPVIVTRDADRIGYHFAVHGVQCDVTGPVRQAAVVRRLAETLIPEPPSR